MSVALISLQEHRACVGMSEVEAKYKYTHMARSLKTYGITFFLVKVVHSPFELRFSTRIECLTCYISYGDILYFFVHIVYEYIVVSFFGSFLHTVSPDSLINNCICLCDR